MMKGEETRDAHPDQDFNPVESPAAMYNECREMMPQGLTYINDFISRNEERELLRFIDTREWNSRGGRRTQQDGYHFNHTTGKLEQMEGQKKIIPKEFKDIITNLKTQGYPHEVDQNIVNERVVMSWLTCPFGRLPLLMQLS